MNTLNAIGIEDEFFVFENEISSALPGAKQRELLKLFSEKYSFRISAVSEMDGLPMQLNKDVKAGYYCIKFDSTYNIIEVAYPPFKDPTIAIEAIAEIRNQFKICAENIGLKIINSGFYENKLDSDSFINKGTVQLTNTRAPSGRVFFDRFYHGKICSTQIHLSLNDDKIFPILSRFYQLEPLIPIYFSNSNVPGVAHCKRLLMLQDGFDQQYNFFGFPSNLAKTEDEYKILQKKSPGFYRDYSLIVPRSFGTWEFRSACAQEKVNTIAQLVNFRLAVLKYVSSNEWTDTSLQYLETREIFKDACLDPKSSKTSNYLNLLRELKVFEKIMQFHPDAESFFVEASKLKGTG